MKPWVAYSLVRVGIFALLFAALLLTTLTPWICAVLAAIISLCVSYLCFGRLRNAVALDIVARRARPPGDADTAAEDL